METSNIVIESDGRMYKVRKVKTEIEVQADILGRFALEKSVKLTNVLDAGILGDGAMGGIGISATPKLAVYTVRLSKLPMRVAFFLTDQKIMVPNFRSMNKSDILHLTWDIPEAMRVYWLVNMPAVNAGDGMSPYSDNQFLVALDNAGRSYRLPVSNCYEDGRLCPGEFPSAGRTSMEVLINGWRQFTQGNWQSDLSDRGGGATTNAKNAENLFRYKPKEPEGFEQLDPVISWELCCTRISNEHINTNIIL